VSRFSSPWEPSLRITTWLVGLVLAGASVAMGILSARLSEDDPTVALLLGAGSLLPLATLAVTWGLGPRGFVLEAGSLRVERPLLPVSVPLASVRAVQTLADGALRGAIRTAGGSGLFGYFGRFWSRPLGAFRLYATSRRGLVLLDTERGRFVLSPHPPAAFADAVLARAPRAARIEGALPAARTGRSFLLPTVLALASVPLILGAVLLWSWAERPVGATVEAQAVRVERRWSAPVEIPLAGIRAVRLLTPEERRGWRRTAGTATGQAAYGRFSSRELGPFRLYAWQPVAPVLIETAEGKVVLTPEDPERFVEAVRARIRSP